MGDTNSIYFLPIRIFQYNLLNSLLWPGLIGKRELWGSLIGQLDKLKVEMGLFILLMDIIGARVKSDFYP